MAAKNLMFSLEVYDLAWRKGKQVRWSSTAQTVRELVAEAVKDCALTHEQGQDVLKSLGLGVVGRWKGCRAELHLVQEADPCK